MRRRCEVQFRKESKLARIGEKIAAKKEFFSFLVDCKKNNIIQSSKMIEDKKNRNYNFIYTIKEASEVLNLRVVVEKDDPYLHLFLELQEKRKVHWKQALACFLVPVMLYAYSVDAGEEKINPKIKIEDELLDDFIDEKFFSFEEKLNLSFDKGFEFEKENEVPSELASSFESTLKGAMEGLYSEEQIIHKKSILDYYDKENNVLDKEYLSKLILINSSDDSDISILRYGRVVYDEIYMILTEAESYIKYRLSDPEFDLKHFLCNLEKLRIYKNMSYTEEQKNVLAFVLISDSKDKILVFNVFTEEKLNESYIWGSDTETIFHELEHLYEMDCSCSSNKIYKSGASFIFSSDAESDEKISSSIYSNRLLTEWSAENIEYFHSGNFDYYHTENLIVHNLEFALSINPDYEYGSLARTIKNRDPLGMWSLFPYMSNEKEELIEYLAMLNSYDKVLYENGETCDEYAKYACSKHIEIFYKNLLYMNEKINDNLLFYSLSMIKAFENTMREQSKMLFDNEFELDDYFLEYKNQFKNYLSLKYDMKKILEIENRISDLTGDEILEFINYPKNVSEDKEEFYFHMFLKMEDRSYTSIDKSYIYVYK